MQLNVSPDAAVVGGGSGKGGGRRGLAFLFIKHNLNKELTAAKNPTVLCMALHSSFSDHG